MALMLLPAGSILSLADNAGELVFDIPLLRAMPAGSVTVGIRRGNG